ncbi:2-keto-4-pentenoate hydratase [Microbacterium deminutum]|uniref:Fumarylacetoacetate hydrolase family protein n=1 Tax=Microbacterium deminutum TaxID=344164 RepID=A0ABP5CUQ4_9MICO
MSSIADLADRLWQADQERQPVPPIAGVGEIRTLADAYAIQTANVARRLAAGERIIGHKVGLTSLAMQQQLGVDQPDFGVITDRMTIGSGGTLHLHELIAPRIEAEFAFTLAREIGANPTLDEVRAAIDSVAVALEIIDSRIADWRIGLLDTVADNASSARIVVGPWRQATDDILNEIIAATLSLRLDDEQVASGRGDAVLGDPLEAVRWLVDALGNFGATLEEGDVILAGAVHASVPLTGDHDWTAVADGFEPVTITTKG